MEIDQRTEDTILVLSTIEFKIFMMKMQSELKNIF